MELLLQAIHQVLAKNYSSAKVAHAFYIFFAQKIPIYGSHLINKKSKGQIAKKNVQLKFDRNQNQLSNSPFSKKLNTAGENCIHNFFGCVEQL